jgi:DNA polymerase-3 subunit alpha
VHTEYSLLDGSCKIKELVARAKELGYEHLAITDHGNMYGVIDFYRACLEAGVHPVIGCEVYVAPGSRFEREAGKNDERYYHLILLAENDTGYHNLMKIVSKGYVEGFYYKPRVDREVLSQYHEGIIALSACLAGEVARNLARGMYDQAKQAALDHEAIFGKGNYFLELQDHGISEQKTVNAGLMRLHAETGIGLVCTNDTHYIHSEDAQAHDVLLCIQTGKKVSDENRMRYEGGQYYLKSEEEMRALFPYAPEALENTTRIAERCHVEIEFGHYKLPHFEVPEGYDSKSYLRKLCTDGLGRRYETVTPELSQRLEYELSVIENMGFVDYFLIVWDYIHFARESGIPVGPGRGSAAGSLVAYCLEITNLDPIRYNLIFERFLNPERVTMPDIDVDFADENRQDVIDYVNRKYGKDHVVQIVTFGTLMAKGVIRDVGRVMDLPYALCDSVAKMIPNELKITIDKALEMNPELKNAYDKDPQIHELIDMSRKLEGLPRHSSTHAAGVVISPKPVDEFVPLSISNDGSVTTQYAATTLEELGLLKMDFLGLRTLSVLKDTVDMVKKNRGIDIDLDHIDFEDAKVYASLGTGHTEGVFQLESAGMKSFMKELKPENIEDVIAGIALYRPGPMDFIPKYLKGKNDASSITYDCPQLEPILKPTYGCIVYQEQVMQIVRDLAGYSFGQSDTLRRAMSKKKLSVMEQGRQDFVHGNPSMGIEGCVARGISGEIANKIYDEMIDFAKYAFNKSHAAVYAVVAYQTAFLKYYYPQEYMAALMTSVIENGSKVTDYIFICRQMGINVLPPDINVCEAHFTVRGKDILYGLASIKSVGKTVIQNISAERERGGRFKSLSDFINRMTGKDMNKRVVECLIKAGALDSLPGTRREKMMIYQDMMDRAAKEQKDTISGQISLFDLFGEEQGESFELPMPKVGEYDKGQLLAFEKEVLGFYISGHPLDEYEGLLKKNVTAVARDFYVQEDADEEPLHQEIYVQEHAGVRDNTYQVIGGMIISKTVKTTKQNKLMAFVTLEDLTGTVEVIIFSQKYEQYRLLLNEDEKVLIRGRVSIGDEAQGKLICDAIVPFSEIPKELWVKFETMDDYAARGTELLQMLEEYDGRDTVCIYIANPKAVKKLGRQYNVGVTETLMETLREKFGEKNVTVVEKTIEKYS